VDYIGRPAWTTCLTRDSTGEDLPAITLPALPCFLPSLVADVMQSTTIDPHRSHLLVTSTASPCLRPTARVLTHTAHSGVRAFRAIRPSRGCRRVMLAALAASVLLSGCGVFCGGAGGSGGGFVGGCATGMRF
jgi:hypothetical protein